MKKIIYLLLFVFSVCTFENVQAQGLYKNETKAPATKEYSPSILQGPPTPPPGPGPTETMPVAEGLLILTSLAGAYVFGKRKSKR